MKKITSFFAPNKRPRPDDSDLVPEPAEPHVGEIAAVLTDVIEDPGPAENMINPAEFYTKPLPLPQNCKENALSKYDIALAVNERLNDTDRFQFLTNVYKPASNYTFKPVMQSKRLRNVQRWWFDKFDQLAFSHVEHGLYCKSCVLFAQESVGKGRNNIAGRFVSEPYRRFKDLTEDWKNHIEAGYHKQSCEMAENFVRKFTRGSTVAQEVDSNYKENVKKNHEMIKTLLEVLLFAARYELPLRGDKDYGRLTTEEPEENDGVFRGLIRLLAKTGDERLKYIINAPGNATYLSPNIQNTLLSCYANIVLHQITDDVNNSGMFTILADETASFSKEFLSVAIRYVDKNCKTTEAFLGFENVSNTSGETICAKLIQKLKELRIDMSGIVGQGYDGAANMAGHIKGVQARMKEAYPTADYFHCANHRVNLASTESAVVLPISRLLSRVQDIIVYFDASPKRMEILKNAVSDICPLSRLQKVQQLSPTRWVDRHRTLISFKELFPAIIVALQRLSEGEQERTAEDLLIGISTFESVVALQVATTAAGMLKHLSVLLQSESIDLITAHEEIAKTIEQLTEQLDDELKFKKIYKDALETGKELGIEETVPQQEKRRRKQVAEESLSVEQYYKRVVHKSYFLALKTQLQMRFSERQRVAFKLQYFLPRFANKLAFDEINEALMQYNRFFTDISRTAIEPEIERWKKRSADYPKQESVGDLLSRFNDDEMLKMFYPIVFTALKLLATLPVTTATSERSFSTMKRILTDSRSSMTVQRLSALAVLSVHHKKAMSVPYDSVIDLFADLGDRRIALR